MRTINRILGRRGVLDGQASGPSAPPATGLVSARGRLRSRELDSFDVVEGLVIKGGPQVEVLNGVSLHGGLVASWPVEASVTAKFVVESLVEHWRAFGLPGYAQFDNDTIFQGTHAHPDVIGRVSRLCLSLGVVPVFVPPRESGFQSAIENYNGTWQAKVWARFEHADLDGLADRSRRHVAALRRHRADRIESGPAAACLGRGAGPALRGVPTLGQSGGSCGSGSGWRHGSVGFGASEDAVVAISR